MGDWVCCWAKAPPESSYVWNQGILHFPMLEPHIQVKQPFIYSSVFLVKSRISIMNAKKAIPTFYINKRIATTYFPFTFSDLWSHHCEGSKKNSCQSFSITLFWPATDHRKTVKDIYNLTMQSLSAHHGLYWSVYKKYLEYWMVFIYTFTHTLRKVTKEGAVVTIGKTSF